MGGAGGEGAAVAVSAAAAAFSLVFNFVFYNEYHRAYGANTHYAADYYRCNHAFTSPLACPWAASVFYTISAPIWYTISVIT